VRWTKVPMVRVVTPGKPRTRGANGAGGSCWAEPIERDVPAAPRHRVCAVVTYTLDQACRRRIVQRGVSDTVHCMLAAIRRGDDYVVGVHTQHIGRTVES
jgi:hypothetical protein